MAEMASLNGTFSALSTSNLANFSFQVIGEIFPIKLYTAKLVYLIQRLLKGFGIFCKRAPESLYQEIVPPALPFTAYVTILQLKDK